MENVTEIILSKSELATFHKNTIIFFTSVLDIKTVIWYQYNILCDV